MKPAKEDPLVKRAAEAGSAVGGGAIGGPLGAAAGQLLKLGSTELLDRVLAPRQRRRIEGLYEEAVRLYTQRLAAGQRPREDDFYDTPAEWMRKLSAPWGDLPPAAAEVIEALFAQAGETFEERKLPFIAHMLVDLLFRGDITAAEAHQLQRLIRDLSWRQFVLLAVFNRRNAPNWLRDVDVPPDDPSGLPRDIEMLAQSGLLGTNEPSGDSYPTASIIEVGLGYIGTTYQGRLLAELLGLHRIPDEEQRAVIESIRRPR